MSLLPHAADPESPPHGSPRGGPGRGLIVAGVLLFAVAFALRFAHIADSSFWQDEIVQLRRTTLTLREAWIHRPADKMPLDYIVQGLLIGDRPDERQARLHACLFGAGFVVAMAAWGWRVACPGLATIAALLSFALPIHVRFSQESGPYALLLLSEALFLGVLLTPPRDPARLRFWWAGVTATLLLCAWSHYLLAIPCGIALLLTLLHHRSRLLPPAVSDGDTSDGAFGRFTRGRRVLLLLAFGFLLGLLPLLAPAVSSFSGQWGWREQEARPTAFNPAEVPRYLDAFAWGYEPDQSIRFSGGALLALMLVGFAGSWRTDRRGLAIHLLLVSVGSFALTLGLFYFLDRWIKERYFVGALPPALFLAGLGLHSIGSAVSRLAGVHGRAAARAAIAVALMVAVLQSAWVLSNPVRRDNWRAVVERARVAAGDSTVLLVADWHSIDVMGYYLELLQANIPFRGIYYGADQLQALLDEGRDVWVFGTHQDWWNIPREDIASFLEVYTRLPLDLPPVEGIEIRRNRTPSELALDRKLVLLDQRSPEDFPMDLLLPGDPSPYLGEGWFVAYDWSAPRYRRALMAARAEILLPLDRPSTLELTARVRLAGEPARQPLKLGFKLDDQSIGEGSVTGESSDLSINLPAEALQSGLNVLTVEASGPLQIPVADAADAASYPSLEIEWLRLSRE